MLSRDGKARHGTQRNNVAESWRQAGGSLKRDERATLCVGLMDGEEVKLARWVESEFKRPRKA